jgi:3-methylcrotonyl-CoA carboxylase alpha subunit
VAAPVAAGEPLPLRQDEVRARGHAVEARLYAEDPEKGFLPSTGRLRTLRLPDACPASASTPASSRGTR